MTQSGTDGVMHAVRERKRSGSDFVKTMTTGGVLHGQESDLNRSLWTKEELQAMVKEADRIGMYVAVHAHGAEGIQLATESKVRTIEHCSLVTEESAKLMSKNKIFLIPTQSSIFTDKPEVMAGISPEVRKKTIKVDDAMFVHHKMAWEKGVKIALGTDVGTPGNFHGKSAWEMTSYVQKMGMTPADAIQTGTMNAAEAINMDHAIGSIETGKFADFLVINSNPLEDITILENASNIDFVFKDGDEVAKNGKLILN